MATRRRAGLAFGASLSAAALAIGPGPPAQAAASPGWRIVFSHQYGAPSSFSLFLAVTAPRASDAWAVGGDIPSGPQADMPVAARWRRGSWHVSALPVGIRNPLDAVSASSAANVWAVSELGGDIVHFNGSRWSVARRLSGIGELTGVTAFSPANVWVFGGPGANPGLGSWRYNGRTWRQATAATKAGIISASALSPADMWAIGSVSAGADSIFHYMGSWQHATASALAGLQFHAVLAKASDNLWALANIATNAFRPYLVHLTGSGWSRVKVPFAVDPIDLSSDGRGGLWLTALDSANAGWVVHRTASGRWSRISLGKSARMLGLALVPGTASLWGAGSLSQTAASKAAVWADGRTG